MFMFGTITDYYLLSVAEFLGAAGMTMISGAEQALLYDSLIELQLEGRARFYFARYEAAGTMGLLIAFPLGSFVAGLKKYPVGLPLPFNMTAVAGIASAAIFFWMLEPHRSRPKEGLFVMGVQGLKTLFVHRDLRAFVLNAVTISSVTFFAFWFYQPAGEVAGMKLEHLGFFAAGFNVFSALLLSNLKRLESAFGIRRLLLYSALIPAALFVALAAEHRLAFVVPAFSLIVGCKMVRVPILNEFINRRIESDNRATVISSVSLLERFATFVLYPLVGFLADVSLDYAFVALGGLCAAFAVGTKISEVHLVEGGGELAQGKGSKHAEP
jgi:hypothetical protein